MTAGHSKAEILHELEAILASREFIQAERLSAFLSNPTDSHDNTFSYGNPFSFQQIAEVTPQRPLTMRVTFGVDF